MALLSAQALRCYEMVERVYSVLSGGVLADKVTLGLRFTGLETQLVNEQMEGISDCRVTMHRLSQERKAELIWGKACHLLQLLTRSGFDFPRHHT